MENTSNGSTIQNEPSRKCPCAVDRSLLGQKKKVHKFRQNRLREKGGGKRGISPEALYGGGENKQTTFWGRTGHKKELRSLNRGGGRAMDRDGKWGREGGDARAISRRRSRNNPEQRMDRGGEESLQYTTGTGELRGSAYQSSKKFENLGKGSDREGSCFPKPNLRTYINGQGYHRHHSGGVSTNSFLGTKEHRGVGISSESTNSKKLVSLAKKCRSESNSF